ncbi:MAG: DNA polymerase III subunit delta, partial [Lachnospiraceae bacterium]|nr:DNA polymerase III subunit delta [Lachnospiraceae bacterium]
GIDRMEVAHIGQTLPFFAPRRLVVVENSGWFRQAETKGEKTTFADALKSFPDTTVVVFCEEEVDKRGRLYKTVKECGHICEFTALDIKDLKLWVAGLLKAEGKKITDGTMNYFLMKVGTDMGNIRTEVEKLTAYTLGRDVISLEDVDAVCTEQVTGQIFKMMDQIAMQNSKNALALYHDLLLLREKPLYVLFLMLRQFNLLMQVKQMGAEGMANAEIAKKAGIPPFAVGKYLSQARAFPVQVLKEALQYGVQTEAQIKSGRMDEQIAVELMLVHFAALAKERGNIEL